MKKIFIILGATLVLFPACQKKDFAIDTNIGNQAANANISLSAVLESETEEDTKTTIGVIDSKQYAVWSENDQIRVFDQNGVYAMMSIVNFNPGQTHANFVANNVPEEFETPTVAFYPESFSPAYENNTINFNLPATQSYNENSFADNTNVAVSKIISEEGGKHKATFMNVFGYLKLQLKGDFKVCMIKLSGHNGEKLNGSFEIDLNDIEDVANFQGAVATDERVTGDDVITLDCTGVDGGGVQLNEETVTTFYIVVPIGAFNRGFVAKIYDDSQTFTLLTTTKVNTISRSTTKKMPEIPFNTDTPKYKEVEYLQATGGKKHIIYTNINAKESVGIFVDFKLNDQDHVQNIIGSFDDACKLNVTKSTDYNNTFNLYFGSDTPKHITGSFSKRHTIRMENNMGYIDGNAGVQITTSPSFTDELPIYLFNKKSNIDGVGGGYGLIGYMYSAYITDNGVKVRDFIPCCCVGGKYTDGDNITSETVTTAKSGMLDLVSGKLFINSHGATGSDFTPGPYVTVN